MPKTQTLDKNNIEIFNFKIVLCIDGMRYNKMSVEIIRQCNGFQTVNGISIGIAIIKPESGKKNRQLLMFKIEIA